MRPLRGRGVKAFDKAGQQIKHLDIRETWTANLSFGGCDKQSLSPTASKGLCAVKRKVKGAARK